MKVELHGSPKEIAALIAELQRRQMESLEVNPMGLARVLHGATGDIGPKAPEKPSN